MRTAPAISILMIAAAATSACRQSEAGAAQADSAELAARERRLASRLAADDGSGAARPLARWFLPPALREVSGLALTADGRLLAHNDEQGKVFVLDPRRGVLLKQFTLGDRGVPGDFEGITVAGAFIYLLTSNGRLYQFREGADAAHVPYTLQDTQLGKECEFEGVAFAADSGWLVMPCKNVGRKSLREHLVVYRWRVRQTDGLRLSMFSIPVALIAGSNGWNRFRASDITVEPATGNYVIISALEKGLIEITPGREVVRAVPLPATFRQPEGVAITKDNILILSDEATQGPSTITLYRWPIGPGESDSLTTPRLMKDSAGATPKDSNTTNRQGTR